MENAATEQPAPRLNLGLRPVQRRRQFSLAVASILFVVMLPFVRSVGPDGGALHEGLEDLGLALILTAIVGRSWCALYIGGRKSSEVVATGPYSVSRNPLYVFSLLGVLGVGLQTGSIVLGLFAAIVGFAIFYPVILREEKALATAFGDEYRAYRQRVPRFGPNFRLWRETEMIIVHPSRLRRTFLEALSFLLAVPICELVDILQDHRYMVPFLHFP